MCPAHGLDATISCLNTWHRIHAFAPQATPDCLFFGCSNDSFALSYAAALKSLRTLLVTWGGCADPLVYTLHSMKSTLSLAGWLRWGFQKS